MDRDASPQPFIPLVKITAFDTRHQSRQTTALVWRTGRLTVMVGCVMLTHHNQGHTATRKRDPHD
jgi:hypothetical protein